MAKRASKRTRVTAAKRGGRTTGRTAKRSNSVRAAPKKKKATPQKAVPAEVPPATKPSPDSEAEVTQTTLREAWKGQQQDAAAFAKNQHGAMLDQRAHVRATTGHRWTARKTH